MTRHKRKHHEETTSPPSGGYKRLKLVLIGGVIAVPLILYLTLRQPSNPTSDGRTGITSPTRTATIDRQDTSAPAVWIQRTKAIDALFHIVYTPCWEGAYGAIGDAYLFATTHDSSLMQFHLVDHNLTKMCVGQWVDDRAWVCLAELTWWDITGRTNSQLVQDAEHRYLEARNEKRFSNFEGFWSWYNWPPGSNVRERIFTNSNMNQMVTVACELYEATRDRRFLQDALLAWNGNGTIPGIEQTWYKGNGLWVGKPGLAAFGQQVPWEGAGYCTVAAALYHATHEPRYRTIAIATAKRIMDPSNNWIDPAYFYQLRMDGNGAFVNFLLDAFSIAPDSLSGLLPKIRAMLEHVWTNHNGESVVTLHRESDNGIRNGWNPYGGEDGYNVDEIGTVHAQGEAVRAFGTFTYYFAQKKAAH